MAGALLFAIVYWSQYGKAEIPGVEGFWYAKEREWWSREARLSPRQYDRAIAALASACRIEKRQWWFGGRNILHVRPSQLTRDFLDAAKTWEAAEELLHDIALSDVTEAQFEVANSGKPGSPNTEKSNGIADNGNPSSPKAGMSNTLIGLQHSFGMKSTDTLTGSHPASPTCAAKGQSLYKEVPEKDKIGDMIQEDAHIKTVAPVPSKYEAKPTSVPTLKEMAAAWQAAVAAFYSHGVTTDPAGSKVSAKELGMLATTLELLGPFNMDDGTVYDKRYHACEIIAYTVEHWTALRAKCGDWGLQKGKGPQIEYFCDNLHAALELWPG